MKKILTGIGLMMILSLGVNAQATKDDHRGRKGKMNSEKFYKDLNLTETQKTEMKAASADLRRQMEMLKKDSSLNTEAKKAKRTAIVKEHRLKTEQILSAEQKTKLAEKRKANPGRKKMDGNGRSKMKQELSLTEDQQKKLQALNETHKKKLIAVRENKSLDETERKKQISALRSEQRKAMNSILTPEQKEKMKENRKHRSKKTVSA